jgi:hypothetical protein
MGHPGAVGSGPLRGATVPCAARSGTVGWQGAPQRAAETRGWSAAQRGDAARPVGRSAWTPHLSSRPSGSAVGWPGWPRGSEPPSMTSPRWPPTGGTGGRHATGMRARARGSRTRLSPEPTPRVRPRPRPGVRLAAGSWMRSALLRRSGHAPAARRCSGPGRATRHGPRPRAQRRGNAPLRVYGARRTVRSHGRPRASPRPRRPRRAIATRVIRCGPAIWCLSVPRASPRPRP